MVREISTATVRFGLTAIRIPIEAALGIARTALGNGAAKPEGATNGPERKRATSAKREGPPRKRAAAKPKAKTTKAKARTRDAQAKPSPKPRSTSPRSRSGFEESATKPPATTGKGDAPQKGAERAKKTEELEHSRARETAEAPTEARQAAQPRQAKPGEAVSGFPEPPGKDPGDISKDPTPHHALSNPVDDPDPTEWPDPYEGREDPRDPPDPDARPFGEEPHPNVGSMSTSEPHPSADPEAGDRAGPPQRDRLDD